MKILLVGGDDRQRHIFERACGQRVNHWPQDETPRRRTACSADAIVVYTRHCTHKLQDAAKSAFKSVPVKLVTNTRELREAGRDFRKECA